MEDGNAGIQNVMTDESIWIPASAGMTKDAIHPRFKRWGILAYLRKYLHCQITDPIMKT
jgi:hypothetical protein